MAKIRFGYSDDFAAKNSGVGINTTDSQANLDVVGVVKGQDLKVTGISSQTGYEGFLRADHQIEENTQLNFGQGINASLSGEIIVGTGQTVTINEVVKETAGVGNNGNLIWKNIAGNYGDGKLSSGLVSNWDGKAFHFDNDEHVELPMSLGYTTKVSAFAWFKHGGTPAGTYHIIFGGEELEISIPSAGQLRTGLLANQRYVENYGSTGQLTDGSWHYIGFTYDGTTKTSYIDGVFVGSQTISGTLDHTFGNRAIGRFGNSNTYYLNGYLSAAQIYDKDLTASEILSNYNLGPYYKEAAVTTGLVLHLNANNPASYPGTLSAVDTTDTTIASGSQIGSLKVFNTFTPPSGGINERPSKPKPGQLYYNYDLKTIEFHDGYGWRQVDYTTRSGRVVIAGGYIDFPALLTAHGGMQSLQVMTLGNTQYFGDLNEINTEHIGCGSEIRGVLGGGYVAPARVDIMQYVTIASASNAIDFGNLSQPRNQAQAVSSSTRGIWGGGFGPAVRNEIDYVEIATLGNALDFGDMTVAHAPGAVGNSPTRGVFISGYNQPQSTDYQKTEYITIASKGNGIDFGESGIILSGGSCGSNTRGVFGGGYQRNPATNFIKTLSYVTMASFGNTVDFGNLTVNMSYASSGGNATRGVFTGSDGSPQTSTNIDYVSVTSLGNGQDFGDLSIRTGYSGAVSDSHGGLGGF